MGRYQEVREAFDAGYTAQTGLVDFSLTCKEQAVTREQLETAEYPELMEDIEELVAAYEDFSGLDYDNITPQKFLERRTEHLSIMEEAGLLAGLAAGRAARLGEFSEANEYWNEHLDWPEL